MRRGNKKLDFSNCTNHTNQSLLPSSCQSSQKSYGVTIAIHSQQEDEPQRVGGQLGIVLCLFVSELPIY